MAGQTFSFPASNTKRFTVYERYSGGTPKSYKDKITGRILSRAQKAAFEKDGFLASMPELATAGDLAGAPDIAPVEPSRRPALAAGPSRPTTDEGAAPTSDGPYNASTAYTPDFTMPDPATGAARKAGLFEAATPGILTAFSSVAAWAAPRYRILFLVPPPDLTTPVFVPLARIFDRHNPIGVSIEATEDGKDLMQSIAAASVCGYWLWHTIAELRAAEAAEAQLGYLDANGNNGSGRANNRPQNGSRAASDGRARGQSEAQAVPGDSWLQQATNGLRERNAYADTGQDYADGGTADANGVATVSGQGDTGWQAEAVRQLRDTESQLRRQKGLQ